MSEYTHEEWRAEAERRFGKDPKEWRFVCPACGYETKVSEWLEHDADKQVAFSCVGRVNGHMDTPMGTKPGPCNYAGGGLFGLNPVKVTYPNGETSSAFAFAEVSDGE